MIDNVDPLHINFFIENGSLVDLDNAAPLVEKFLASPSPKIGELYDIFIMQLAI